ncbi:hypothetical protein D3C85_1629060 [compost metagenome]
MPAAAAMLVVRLVSVAAVPVPPALFCVRLPAVSTHSAEPSVAVMVPALSIFTSSELPPMVTVAVLLAPAAGWSEAIVAAFVRPVSPKVKADFAAL